MKRHNIKISQFTKIAFVLCVFGIIVQLYIGLRHINAIDEYEVAWARICLMEAFFGIIGLISIDLIMNTWSGIFPKNFKRIDSNLMFHTGIALISILLIQIIFQATLTIEDYEKGMAILFCSVCEELFFRGFLMFIFIRIGSYTKKIKVYGKKEISPITIMGIVFQAYLFAAMHINYYNNIPILMSMFFSGIVLGIYIWLWQDLTAVILAHFLLNMICVIQTFYVFTL